MIVKILQQVFRFVFLVALQVIVLNHIQWSGYVNPYIYILFILMLPVEIPNWLLLVLSFAAASLFSAAAALLQAGRTTEVELGRVLGPALQE